MTPLLSSGTPNYTNRTNCSTSAPYQPNVSTINVNNNGAPNIPSLSTSCNMHTATTVATAQMPNTSVVVSSASSSAASSNNADFRHGFQQPKLEPLDDYYQMLPFSSQPAPIYLPHGKF